MSVPGGVLMPCVTSALLWAHIVVPISMQGSAQRLVTGYEMDRVLLHELNLLLCETVLADCPWIGQCNFLNPVIKVLLYNWLRFNESTELISSLNGGEAATSGWMGNNLYLFEVWFQNKLVPHKHGVRFHWIAVGDRFLLLLYYDELTLVLGSSRRFGLNTMTEKPFFCAA